MLSSFAKSLKFDGIPGGRCRKSTSTVPPDGLGFNSSKQKDLEEKSSAGAPVVIHVHGGGLIMGSIALVTPVLISQVSKTLVPVLAVGYRLAPENSHPIPVVDVYSSILWLQEHATELGVDPARIAISGESSGGGIAAGAALMAQDKKLRPALAKQILSQPILDDRNTVADNQIEPFAFWTYDDNKTGWTALLGDKIGGDNVDYHASAARASNLSGLPDTYLAIGQLDIFIYETMEFARQLTEHGVNVELHVYPGCCHGFDMFARGIESGQAGCERQIHVHKE